MMSKRRTLIDIIRISRVRITTRTYSCFKLTFETCIRYAEHKTNEIYNVPIGFHENFHDEWIIISFVAGKSRQRLTRRPVKTVAVHFGRIFVSHGTRGMNETDRTTNFRNRMWIHSPWLFFVFFFLFPFRFSRLNSKRTFKKNDPHVRAIRKHYLQGFFSPSPSPSPQVLNVKTY